MPVQTIHTVCKLSRLSRNFPDSQETFQLKVNILEAKTFRSVKCQRSFSASAETFVRNDQRLTTHLPPKRFHNLTCELIGIMIWFRWYFFLISFWSQWTKGGWQIHFAIWTNKFCNLGKYISQLYFFRISFWSQWTKGGGWEIHFAIWTNKFCNLGKYISQLYFFRISFWSQWTKGGGWEARQESWAVLGESQREQILN